MGASLGVSSVILVFPLQYDCGLALYFSSSHPGPSVSALFCLDECISFLSSPDRPLSVFERPLRMQQNPVVGVATPRESRPHLSLFCLETRRYVVALTGAGASAESGIPTFRDPADGLWKK